MEIYSKDQYGSITVEVPSNGSIAQTLVKATVQLNNEGYKVISHSVASLHHNPSTTLISILAKLKA